jgi:hypothetical protein
MVIVRLKLSCSDPNFSKPRSTTAKRIFGITKLRVTHISLLELMHQEQTNTSIAGEIETQNP